MSIPSLRKLEQVYFVRSTNDLDRLATVFIYLKTITMRKEIKSPFVRVFVGGRC